MYCILVIGMTGQGKSEFIKNYIRGKRSFVFDVNNEYKGIASEIDTSFKETNFTKECLKKEGTILVFEEATGFLEGRTAPDIRRLIISKRHKRNNIVFLFHSISSVPPRILQLTNYVVLFKTNDEEYQVEKKYPSLFPHYLEVKKLPRYGKKIIKLIEQ